MKQVYCALISLIAAIAASEYYTYQSGLATSELVPALLNKDHALFQSLLLNFIFLTALSALLSSLTSLATNFVSYSIRFYMLDYLQTFLKLVEHDFDQRWTQDLDLLSINLSSLLTILIPAPFMIVFYWIQSHQIAGAMAPIIVAVYATISSIVAGIAGTRLPSYIYNKERLEGVLRVQFVHIRRYLEDILILSGTMPELKMLAKSVSNLKSIQLIVMMYIFVINTWSKLVSYCGGLVPYFCISIAIFNHQYDNVPMDQLAGKIQMASFILLMLMNRFTTIIEQFPIFFQCFGYYKRVTDSIQLFKENKKDLMTTKYQYQTFGLQNATARVDSKLVFENKTILLHHQSVLLCGCNGSGKTSLIRLLKQEWPDSTGLRIFPKDLKWMILPSNSYFVQGSIKENIIYPNTDTSNVTNEEVQDILKKLDLEFDQLDTELSLEYYTSLSDGEQQKLNCCRVLYNKPDYLIMDESVVHLDAASLRLFYEFLKETNCVYMTISHDRLQLEEYHDDIIYWTSNENENQSSEDVFHRPQRYGLF